MTKTKRLVPLAWCLAILHPVICNPGTPFIFCSRLNTRERMANLVQSITCFDTTICLRRHINCFGSVRGNIVSCSAPLCCLNNVIRCHKVPGCCATKMMMPARNTSQNFTMSSLCMCVCVCVCRCSFFRNIRNAGRKSNPVAHLSDHWIYRL